MYESTNLRIFGATNVRIYSGTKPTLTHAASLVDIQYENLSRVGSIIVETWNCDMVGFIIVEIVFVKVEIVKLSIVGVQEGGRPM